METANSPQPPICLKCKIPMELRNGWRGPFWGCPNYKKKPKCEYTIDYIGAVGSEDDDLPRHLCARAKQENKEVKFLECISLPENIISYLFYESLNKNILQSIAQWRLDYTKPLAVTFNPDFRAALSVAEKILTRGKVTLSLLDIEEYIYSVTKKLADNNFQDELFSLSITKAITPDYHNFAANEAYERNFLEDIIRRFGPYIAQFFIHQVEVSSLVSLSKVNRYKDQRVDFLFSFPGGPHIVIEIDGPQHADQVSADRDRDGDLQAAGYDVIRIPVHEVGHARGEHTSKLLISSQN